VRSLAALGLSLMLTSAAIAGPSFDCEKATSDVEKVICQDDGPITGGGSAWLDRQLARLYAIAKERLPPKERSSLVAAQQKFLRDRDACFARPRCRLEGVYRARLTAIARAMGDDRAFQVFGAGGQLQTGQLQIARFGKSAAISIWTVGGNDHVCQFEQDGLPLGDDGAVRFYDEQLTFRIVVAPVEGGLQVTTEGHEHCGARASMDGIYTLQK
jgi:uncharacterized protein